MTVPSTQPPAAPRSVADEVLYDLLRDEWELLLAVGDGPTALDAAAARVGLGAEECRERLELLVTHGLLARGAEGYRLVPVIHERREGMSSFLRDLVIRRLELGGEEPLHGGVRGGLGDPDAMEALIASADATLLPAVFEAARPAAGPQGRRYALFFTAAASPGVAVSSSPGPAIGEPAELVAPLLAVLRAAAAERANDQTAAHAKLWVADMRTDPEVAARIAGLFASFLDTAPAPGAGHEGPGAAAFALLASDPLKPHEGE